ncbi:MAG: putative DNA-binding domain-containing protein [Gammaproteobacteria bacterium]|nr:putative DNA-binding domain-containing protein [Gammaproteobacteria bacterium]
MQNENFFSFVRGGTETIPVGHKANGCEFYRYLVYLGVEQLLADVYPQIKEGLGAENWEKLLQFFILQSEWTSNYYADLEYDFNRFLVAENIS